MRQTRFAAAAEIRRRKLEDAEQARAALPDKTLMETFRHAYEERQELTSRLDELSGIPTLVVSARHDPIAPPALGGDIASRIRGARYVEFDNASHAVPIQLAREVNALLSDHFTMAENQSGRR